MGGLVWAFRLASGPVMGQVRGRRLIRAMARVIQCRRMSVAGRSIQIAPRVTAVAADGPIHRGTDGCGCRPVAVASRIQARRPRVSSRPKRNRKSKELERAGGADLASAGFSPVK